MTEITNDTEVFDAMRFDAVSGDMVWTGRMGTREAIHREKLAIDQGSWKYCPHQWLDERGFVDRELSRRHPHSWPPTLEDAQPGRASELHERVVPHVAALMRATC